MTELGTVATYVRVSDEKQTQTHQREDIAQWLERNGLSIGEVDVYAEQASRGDESRSDILELIEELEAGTYTDIVVWEISRIAEQGVLAQRFFDAAEAADAVIHVTNGSIRKVRPDGTGRLIADIIASVAAEERRSLIRRTKSGLRRARESGKWLGGVPAGFLRVDGYLKPNLDPDYGNGETGFHDIVNALERIERGESYRSVAQDVPNLSRPGLMKIHKDETRRRWYLDADADKEAVAEALQELPESAGGLPP